MKTKASWRLHEKGSVRRPPDKKLTSGSWIRDLAEHLKLLLMWWMLLTITIYRQVAAPDLMHPLCRESWQILCEVVDLLLDHRETSDGISYAHVKTRAWMVTNGNVAKKIFSGQKILNCRAWYQIHSLILAREQEIDEENNE